MSSIITSPEFFINMKKVPTPDSVEYKDFVKGEMDKLQYGVTINGVYISNWLYWHLNYWKLYRPEWNDKRGEVVDIYTNPQLRDNEWMIAESLHQAKREQKGVIIIGSRRIAKELLNSSKLYTDNGEITIGDCQVGDKIFGHNGKLTNVIGVYPQGKVPIYKMTLMDGRELFCGLEHNWLVSERAKIKKNKVSKTYNREVVKTTKELIDSGLFRLRKHTGYKDGNTHIIKEYKYWIPNNEAVDYSKKDNHIPPYLLGVWLGDGTSTKPQITNIDIEILDYINEYAKLNNLLVKNYDNKISYSLVKNKELTNSNIFLNSLRKNNLLNNKHIPKNYLYSSIEDRLELLRGLMDTDGSCTKSGVITFSTTSFKLSEDFYFLCRSLGINLSKSEYIPTTTYKSKKVECKKAYKFTLFTRLPIFKVKRKLSNMKLDNKKMLPRLNKTAIVSIDYVFDDYATCITVDNKDSLYLTDNFTTTHNTSFISSWVGLGATIYEGSQNIIVGNNKNDIKNITSQMDKGLNSVESFLRYNRLRDDWRSQVDLGFKYKDGNSWKTEEWSQIHIRNTEEGINTEVLAGLTPKTLVFDEIGKAKTKEVFLGSIPAYNSPYGWRCVPVLCGTGGDMKKGEDAKEMFENPERYNLLTIEVPHEQKKTGVFISGLMAVDVPKIAQPLSTYLDTPKGSELDNITIHVSDKEKGLEIITKSRENFLKANNQVDYLKAVMYAPLTIDECFMNNEEENPFPVEALKQHLDFLKRNNVKKNVRLFRDVDGKVSYAIDNKRFEVTEFPATKDTDKNAPVIMYEDPMHNAPSYLYIAGGDPYNQNKSEVSPSLGTLHVYKRTYDPVAGTFQHTIVASYAARPETMKDWQETVEMLLELYNATCMIENEGTNFIQYMENKNKGHYLADGYNLAKEINPKTSIQGRVKGLPATLKIKNHYKNLIIQYCNEKLTVGQKENGELVEALGLVRIKDEMLITELINFKPKGNFDRIVSFGHCLIYDEYLQKIAPNVKIKSTDVTPQKKNSVRSPFIMKSGSNAFGI